MSDSSYSAQHRGDPTAYERYLRGMDASLRQKVALTAAHLLCQGHVADMGMGSGGGSQALAALYPDLQVTGVDVNEAMVARAREVLRLPNLDFRQGDIAQPCFEPASLDGIFDSSVLHHVTSFTGYEHEAAARALAVQAEQLKPYGVLIVRDFLAPGAGLVGDESPAWLDVPGDDGHADADGDPGGCSTAALLERFGREFRRLHEQAGCELEAVTPAEGEPELRPGWRRYLLSHRLAVEFVLRKDYRADWETEILEEYTYFTQARFEQVLGELGLRTLASTPLRNPWIVRNRFQDRFELRQADTASELDWPATNYVIAAERVPAGAGVRIERGSDRPPSGFLELNHYRHRGGRRGDRRTHGQVFDLVRRPHLTCDILPWFRESEQVFVLARGSYPRPILRAAPEACAALDGARPPSYVAEPLAVLQEDKPLGQTVEEALAARAGLGSELLVRFLPGAHYYPSPGGIQEEVRSLLVEVAETFVNRELGDTSGFSTSGVVRAIEARQLLRSAQVGGLPNARLELNVYELLARLGLDPGPWIGEALELCEPMEWAPEVTPLAELLDRPSRRAFVPASAEDSSGFLELAAAEFVELDGVGQALARRTLEYVLPRAFSGVTVATALLVQRGDQVLLGLADDDLPAAQCFTGNSELLVAPAWRLPREVSGSRRAAEGWLRQRLRQECGLECGEVYELGGRYHPSPGVTPEVVHPWAIEVEFQSSDPPAELFWVPVAEALAARQALADGHLGVVLARVAHALGMWACR